MKTTALRSMLRTLPLLAMLALGGGCGSSDIIDPIIEIPPERSLVVVPFKDEDFQNGWDSPRGTELAGRVTKNLAEKAEFKVTPLERAMEIYDSTNPRELTSQEIAEKTGADYVLRGDVLLFRTRDPGAVNALRGTAIIAVSIYETPKAAKKANPDAPLPKKGRIVRTTEVSATFPNEYGLEKEGVWEIGEHTAEWIATGLKATAARAVAQLLYGHTKEEAHLTQQ